MADNGSLGGGKKAKLYNVLEFGCVAVLAVFCVLLFGFFAAPVIEFDLDGELELNVSTFSSEVQPLGELDAEIDEPVLNVYTSTSEENDLFGLSGVCSALITLAVFALAFAVVAFLVYRRSCAVPDRLGKLNRTFIFNCGAAVVHLIFLILGAAMISRIKSDSDGLMAAGAAPVLITVFSAVFLAVTVAALVGCYLLAAKNADEITLRKLERAGMTVDRDKDIAVQLEYNKQNYALNKLINGKARRIKAIDNKERSETDKLEAMKRDHESLPRVGSVTLDDDAKRQYTDRFKKAHRLYALNIMFLPIIFELLFYTLLIPLFVYKGNPWKCSARRLKTFKGLCIASIVIFVAALGGACALLVEFLEYVERNTFIVGLVLTFAAFFLPLLISAIVGLRRIKRLTVDLYGTAKPQKDAVPCVDVGDLSDFWIAQEKARVTQNAVDARALTDDTFDPRIAAQQEKLLSIAVR